MYNVVKRLNEFLHDLQRVIEGTNRLIVIANV